MPAPKKNVAYTFDLTLVSQANRPQFQVNPTIAVGDFKVSTDEGLLTNLTNLPAVAPVSSRIVKVVLTAAEMNGDRVVVQAVDAVGAEWDEVIVYIDTTAVTVDDLVRSTTPANTLDVSATGEVGLDFDNVKVASVPTTLTNIRVPNVTLTDTVTTYTGNTVQTGDAFARLGAPAGLSVSADMAAVKTDTAAILVDTGTTLDARIPAALVGGRMDSSTGAMAADVVTAAAIATDAIGAAEFAQAAADKVWLTAARALTDKVGFALSAAGIQALWDALTAALVTVGSIGKLLVDNVNATVGSRSSHTAADVWTSGTRTLTSFGTLVADIWANATRTLTGFSTTLALSVWDVLTANILTGASIGLKLKNWALGTDNRALVSADVHTSGQTVAAVAGAVGSVTGAVGSVTGAVGSVTGAVGSVTAAVTVGTNNDKTGYALTTADKQDAADELLNRNLAGAGSGGARNIRNALRILRNKRGFAAGTLTVYQEDDTTSAWTATVTQTAGNPVTDIDPV